MRFLGYTEPTKFGYTRMLYEVEPLPPTCKDPSHFYMIYGTIEELMSRTFHAVNAPDKIDLHFGRVQIILVEIGKIVSIQTIAECAKREEFTKLVNTSNFTPGRWWKLYPRN